jgi:hypothetical protein
MITTNKNEFYKESILNELNSKILNEGFRDRKDSNDSNNSDYRPINLDGLTSKDIKQVNSLRPLVNKIEVNYRAGERIHKTDIVVGSKAVFHMIENDELVYYIQKSIKDGDIVFKVIQWTQGEISFFKDLLFNVDELKDEALSKRSVNKSLWNLLKRRSFANKSLNILGRNKMIPNATLVVSMNEIEILKNKYYIDLLDDKLGPKYIEQLMDIFSFINVIIADDSDELMYFYNERYNRFDALSYRSLKSKGGKDNTDSIANLIASSIGKK